MKSQTTHPNFANGFSLASRDWGSTVEGCARHLKSWQVWQRDACEEAARESEAENDDAWDAEAAWHCG